MEDGDVDAIKHQYVDAVRKMAVTQVRALRSMMLELPGLSMRLAQQGQDTPFDFIENTTGRALTVTEALVPLVPALGACSMHT